MVEGEISAWLFSMAFIKLSILSCTPASTSQNLSVLAVHKTNTFSKSLAFLKFLISSLIQFKSSILFLLFKILSALVSQLEAMKSGQQIAGKGTMSFMWGLSFRLSCNLKLQLFSWIQPCLIWRCPILRLLSRWGLPKVRFCLRGGRFLQFLCILLWWWRLG